MEIAWQVLASQMWERIERNALFVLPKIWESGDKYVQVEVSPLTKANFATWKMGLVMGRTVSLMSTGFNSPDSPLPQDPRGRYASEVDWYCWTAWPSESCRKDQQMLGSFNESFCWQFMTRDTNAVGGVHKWTWVVVCQWPGDGPYILYSLKRVMLQYKSS